MLEAAMGIDLIGMNVTLNLYWKPEEREKILIRVTFTRIYI